ncbi:MAG: T9SS type A sorting domain-containing protein [Bacteroidales bacterium]|nr:T9SS type A sorting domain-containing protein [Bacteroidales bacterium]
MKIKIYLISLFLALFTLSINAQIINLNPDPDGDPWIAGGLPEITLEIQAKMDAIPEMVLSSISSRLDLPEVVDNSQNMFMRPIFLQSGGSCGQASGVGYDFTYEINWARDLHSNVIENQYPTHFTWNFLNEGSGYGSWYFDGWDIIMENGCPNFPTWGGMAGDPRRWMTGYDNYYLGMHNKVDSYWYINVGTPTGLETFKHWIDNHNAGTEIGGLGCFAIYMSGNVYGVLPPASAEAGKAVIGDWNSSTGGYHAMTFVGFNDNIKYDINNDGLFTNDMDTNGDGIVDMRDWEIGALKIANSWGLSWPGGQYSDGYIYFPYRLLAKAGAITAHKVYVLIAKEEYTPELTVKANVEYPTTNLDDPARRKLEFNVGYAYNANQTTPINYTDFNSFNNQGGYHPMQGINFDPIEVGLDFGYWYQNEDVGKIFFIVDENEYPAPPNDGNIEYFSIIDYRWGEVFELYCDETNVAIVNDDETILSIDYDLIPHESNITENLFLFSNMVSRFTPTVDNNATLTVEDGVRVDMYNSEIHINGGSSIVLEDNVTFLAKTGSCKIVIDGNISIGSNVSFISEEGALLEVLLNNNSLQATFNNATFNKCRLHNYGIELDIANSTFNNCGWIYSFHGNVTVANCDFSETWLYLENQTTDPNLIATVKNSTFNNINAHVGIDVWNYGKYFIQDNDIKAHHNGIQIFNSGDGNSGNQLIYNNNIHNCDKAGILAYNTTGSIAVNHIHNNRIGLKLMNGCNIALCGNPGASSFDEMNHITDNDEYEIYISKYSFPWYFRYNAIIDEDNAGNPDDPLLYFAYPAGSKVNQKDIRYNCWGNNFDAAEDLYPSTYFIYNPTWCPGGSSIETDVAEQMYMDGKEQFDTQQYTQSKATFMLLIDQYPETEYAVSAMKELVVLEKFVSNDYESLKNYYQSNDSIQADTILQKLAVSLSNKCDVKLENWPDAIDHYESIINDPETLEDSVFAIIDLGYVYFLMENSGYKSSYTGQLTQYKPESKEQFFDHRDYLLSLLPGDNVSESMKGNIAALKEGELLQNVPNPFKGSTQIWYKLENELKVQLNVYNYTGQLISSFNVGTKTKGNHHIDFDANGLKSGIYFYSISINGQTTDSKKMTIMK